MGTNKAGMVLLAVSAWEDGFQLDNPSAAVKPAEGLNVSRLESCGRARTEEAMTRGKIMSLYG